MKISRFSAYTLDKKALGKPDFLNISDYSRFKYGHKPTVITFAKKILETFLSKYSFDWIAARKDEIVITTSPYWHTPPSANSLAVAVHHLLNESLFEHGIGSIKFVKINRSAAPSCDFSQLSVKERAQNMKKDQLSVDTKSVKKQRVVLVEDSRITGAHEEKTIKYLEKAGVHELILLYVIDVKDGKLDPDVENRINHITVNSLDELYKLMKNPDEFILNGRACRFLLSWDNKDELEHFCKKIPLQILSDIYVASINDGYGLMDKYRAGFEVLRREYKRKNDTEFLSLSSALLQSLGRIYASIIILISWKILK